MSCKQESTERWDLWLNLKSGCGSEITEWVPCWRCSTGKQTDLFSSKRITSNPTKTQWPRRRSGNSQPGPAQPDSTSGSEPSRALCCLPALCTPCCSLLLLDCQQLLLVPPHAGWHPQEPTLPALQPSCPGPAFCRQKYGYQVSCVLMVGISFKYLAYMQRFKHKLSHFV